MYNLAASIGIFIFVLYRTVACVKVDGISLYTTFISFMVTHLPLLPCQRQSLHKRYDGKSEYWHLMLC